MKKAIDRCSRLQTTGIAALFLAFSPLYAFADAAAEMARKLQNPLANIKSVMTDNNIDFDVGNDDGTGFGMQLQPVYAIDLPEKGFTLIPRAVIPIVHVEPGSDKGFLPPPDPSATESVSGISDSVVQLFYAPYTDGDWKWGVGPQVSLPTATDDALKGPQWGGGLAGVLVGNLTPELSFAGIVANHWGENDFNTMMIQPMLFYNFAPGKAIAYNAVITADWNADSSDRWTVPIGLSWNQTIDMGGGHGFDYMIGPYYNVARPDGAPRWQIRFMINWLFP